MVAYYAYKIEKGRPVMKKDKFVIIIYGLAHQLFAEKLLLKSYDPEGNDGFGDVGFTQDANEAMLFDSPDKALELWKCSPVSRPLRPDGMPNRPLTAYTIEVVQASNIKGSLN